MKRKLFAVAFFMGFWGAYCQVGIGTKSPNVSSELDVVSIDKGVLIPRIALTSTKDTKTIKGGDVNGYENSLLVFNTLTQNDIIPGYYYWYQDKWMRILDQETLEQYLTKYGGNVHYDGTTLTFVNENGDAVTIDLSTIIQAGETVTTLVKDPLNNGKYTYTNEAGLAVVIDVQADVSNNFEEIINRTEVQEILNQYITENGGNIHYDGDSFTYVDENGQTVSLDMTTIVKGSETVTTLVKDPLNNGKYTYTNEAGLAVVIDVQADVSNNFEEIINRTEVQEILNQYITENGGNIHYDGDSFTYVDENGQTVSLDMTTIVKGSETVTTLVKDPLNNGKYTYTNESGAAVIIDVQADVVNNFEEIINRTEVQEILNQYITENGGNIHYDGDSFTYVDENGQTVSLDMTTIVKGSETVTTLVKDPLNNGKYTYTNESGAAVIIDVQADVVNNFEEIINKTEVQELLTQVINNNGGNVHFDGDNLTYTDENGASQAIDLTALIQASETVTTLVKDPLNNGKYTYTNESGAAVIIDVQADVVNNFEEIINKTEVQELLTQVINNNGGNVHFDGDNLTYTDENGASQTIDLTALIQASETVTTLVKDPLNNGKYTYTNEAGLAVVIDVQADVVNNFEEIINKTEVQELLTQVINNNGGNVHFDGDNLTYTDENGASQTIDLTALIQASETVTTLVKDPLNNGKYTYTNEAGLAVVIDVQADVVNNFEEIINKTEVQELLTQVINNNGGNVHFDGDNLTYTDENGTSQAIDLTALIQASETVTTLVKDPLNNGKYTYTNESGAAVIIDVQADVVNNFEEIIADTNVENALQLLVNKSNKIVETTVNYTALDLDATILVDAEVSNLTITLPSAASVNKGRIITIRKIDESEHAVSFSQQIKANKTQSFTSLNYATTIRIQSNGVAWYMID